MSIEAMKWAMKQNIVTSPTDRHVLLVMANNARDDGTAAFPSISTIAKTTGLSTRTVQYSIQRLLKVGAIRIGSNAVVAAHIKRPDQRPNNYDLAIERGASDDTERGAAAARGASDDMNGVHLTTERGAAAAPEPSFNPPKEPSYSVSKDTGGGPPKPSDFIFGFGLPLLMQAGSKEKQARSFLGMLCKRAGDEAVVQALQRCADEKPIQPLEWLAAALPADSKNQRKAGGNTIRTSPDGIAGVDSKPQWCIDAGFENVWEAENNRCWRHNAHEFRDGRRVAA